MLFIDQIYYKVKIYQIIGIYISTNLKKGIEERKNLEDVLIIMIWIRSVFTAESVLYLEGWIRIHVVSNQIYSPDCDMVPCIGEYPEAEEVCGGLRQTLLQEHRPPLR